MNLTQSILLVPNTDLGDFLAQDLRAYYEHGTNKISVSDLAILLNKFQNSSENIDLDSLNFQETNNSEIYSLINYKRVSKLGEGWCEFQLTAEKDFKEGSILEEEGKLVPCGMISDEKGDLCMPLENDWIQLIDLSPLCSQFKTSPITSNVVIELQDCTYQKNLTLDTAMEVEESILINFKLSDLPKTFPNPFNTKDLRNLEYSVYSCSKGTSGEITDEGEIKIKMWEFLI